MPVQSSPTITLQGLYDEVGRLNELHASKRAELRSAIKTVGKACGQPLSAIIADPPSVRAAVAKASPQLAGISKASWANALSRLSKAMKLLGISIHRRWRQFKLDSKWIALLEPLAEIQRRDLCRVAGWHTVKGIMPEQVNAVTFRDFLEYLQTDSLLRDPRERWHVARRAWNRAVAEFPEQYPQISNVEESGWRGLTWDELPVTLRDEIAAYREFKLDNDPFAESAVAGDGWFRRKKKTVKEISVNNYISSARQYVLRLIEAGTPVGSLASLAALVDIKAVKAGLKLQAGDRVKDGKFTAAARPGLHATMTAILSIADYLAVDFKHLEDLKWIAKMVRHRPTGMCDRNKTRLGQFSEPEVMRRFARLPLDIAKRLENVVSPTLRQAQEMQLAVVLELEMHAPMRVKNAASLRLDKHFQFPVAGAAGSCRLSIPAGEVKNDKAIDVEFSPETTAFLSRYVSVFRPVLGDTKSPALFLTQVGEEKGPSALSKQFAKFIRRELGLTVNIHLMRHLMAFAFLKANPGDYEGARQLLGHKQVETTIKFYSGTESAAAFRRLDKLIDRLRDDGSQVGVDDDDADAELEDLL